MADKTADITYSIWFILYTLTDIISSQNSSNPVTDSVTDPVEKLLAVLNTKKMIVPEKPNSPKQKYRKK